MATAEQLSRFRSTTAALVALAHRDLNDFWSGLNLSGDPQLVRDDLLRFFPELVQAYGDAAALIGADFYDELRDVPPSAARFTAVLADTAPTEQAAGSVRWALGPLFQTDPDPQKVLERMVGASQRLVLQPARSTIFNSGRRDPVRTGFARVPVGVTCDWCTMLAGRGFVYGSAESAGVLNDWHDDCNCLIVPGTSADALPDDIRL